MIPAFRVMITDIETVLSALYETDSRNPATISLLSERLPNIGSERIEKILDDLVDCRTVNRVTVTREGSVEKFYWCTGLTLESTAKGRMLLAQARAGKRERPIREIQPIVVPSEIFRDMNRQDSARQKQQEAESNKEADTPNKEADTKEDLQTEETMYTHISDQILSVLKDVPEENAKSVDELLPLCTMAKTRNSLAHALRDMHRRGQLAIRKQLRDGRYYNLYWINPAKNGNGETRSMEESSQDQDVANDSQEPRFSIWDDGSLLVTMGAAKIRIPQERVPKLVSFLGKWQEG